MKGEKADPKNEHQMKNNKIIQFNTWPRERIN